MEDIQMQNFKRLGVEDNNVWLCLPRNPDHKPTSDEANAIQQRKLHLRACSEVAQEELSSLAHILQETSSTFESNRQSATEENEENPFQSQMESIFDVLQEINNWLPSLGNTVSESERQVMLHNAQAIGETWQNIQSYISTEMHEDEMFIYYAKDRLEKIVKTTRVLNYVLLEWHKVATSPPPIQLTPEELYSQLQVVKMQCSLSKLKHEIEVSCHIGSQIKKAKNYVCDALPMPHGSANIGPLFMRQNITDSPTTSWLSMKPIFGPTLAELLVQCQGKIPPLFIYHVFIGLVDALSFLQTLGVTHNNVSPENILFDPYGSCKQKYEGKGLANTSVLLIGFSQAEIGDPAGAKQLTKDSMDMLRVILTLFRNFHEASPKSASRFKKARMETPISLAALSSHRKHGHQLGDSDFKLLELEDKIKSLFSNNQHLRLDEVKANWYEASCQEWEQHKHDDLPRWMHRSMFDGEKVVSEQKLLEVAERGITLRFTKRVEELKRLIGDD